MKFFTKLFSLGLSINLREYILLLLLLLLIVPLCCLLFLPIGYCCLQWWNPTQIYATGDTIDVEEYTISGSIFTSMSTGTTCIAYRSGGVIRNTTRPISAITTLIAAISKPIGGLPLLEFIRTTCVRSVFHFRFQHTVSLAHSNPSIRIQFVCNQIGYVF